MIRFNMLTFDELKPGIYKQASIFAKAYRNIPLDEFVSIAWLACHHLKEVTFVSGKARWAILSFLRKERLIKERERPLMLHHDRLISLDEMSLDKRELIDTLIKGSFLSSDDKDIIYCHYYQGKSFNEISKERGQSKQWISWKHKQIIKELRKELTCMK